MTCLSFPPDMRSRATCLRTTSYVLLQSKSSPLELCLSEFCTSCMIAVAYHISLGLNILDWSCKDMIAVALHDTVFVQNVTSRHCQELPLELRTQTSGRGGETEGSSSVETEVGPSCEPEMVLEEEWASPSARRAEGGGGIPTSITSCCWCLSKRRSPPRHPRVKPLSLSAMCWTEALMICPAAL